MLKISKKAATKKNASCKKLKHNSTKKLLNFGKQKEMLNVNFMY